MKLLYVKSIHHEMQKLLSVVYYYTFCLCKTMSFNGVYCCAVFFASITITASSVVFIIAICCVCEFLLYAIIFT